MPLPALVTRANPLIDPDALATRPPRPVTVAKALILELAPLTLLACPSALPVAVIELFASLCLNPRPVEVAVPVSDPEKE
jgi:hypothetical protein